MFKSKKLFASALTAALAISLLAGCGGDSSVNVNTGSAGGSTSSGKAEYTCVIASALSSDHYVPRAFQDMADYITENSDGRIEVNTFFDATLTGDDNASAEMISNGTITFSQADLAGYANYADNSDLGFCSIPYLLSPDGDSEHWTYFLDNSELIKEIYADVEEKTGIRLLAAVDASSMCLMYNGDPCVDDLSPLKGKKIRCPDRPGDLATLKAIGINATPMAFSEVFTSLQQGTVDGLFACTTVMADYSFGEITNQYLDLGVYPSMYTLGMNAKFYDSLPADLQEVIDGAIEVYTTNVRKYAKEDLAGVYDEIEKQGCNITYLEGNLREQVMTMVEPYIQSRLDEMDSDLRERLLSDIDTLYAEYDAQN